MIYNCCLFICSPGVFIFVCGHRSRNRCPVSLIMRIVNCVLEVLFCCCVQAPAPRPHQVLDSAPRDNHTINDHVDKLNALFFARLLWGWLDAGRI